MNLSEITTKCYILALIIRDDDERLLLGDGFFEFTDKLQHFTPNTFQNDVVELQGTDGQLLAGQVRRTAMQSFDGYVGDATVSQQTTEENRRRFLAFFRKKHFYKVIYIFPDGTAIKRQRGYIVDAPSVKEMFQRFPEYHVGLNFEDPNYYEYDEDESGHEIFAHAQEIFLSNLLVGGLVWDEYGAVSHAIAWGDYETQTTSDGFLQISNDIDIRAPLSLTHLYGNATQETLSGKNLLPPPEDFTQTINGVSIKCENGVYAFSGTATANGGTGFIDTIAQYTIQSGDYFHYCNTLVSAQINIALRFTDDTNFAISMNQANRIGSLESYVGKTIKAIHINLVGGNTFNGTASPMILHNVSTQTDFEPYCGGVPMPNPQFASDVNVVSGAQEVKVVGKNLINQVETNKSVSTSGNINTASTSYLGIDARMPVMPNTTYAVSFEHDIAEAGLFVGFWDADGNFLGREGLGAVRTFTAPANASEVFYYVYRSANPFTTIGGWVQCEFGSTPTSYEPYQSQSQTIDLGSEELAGVGEIQPDGLPKYRDCFRNIDGTWYIHKEVGKVVLTGDASESWSVANTGTASWYYITGAIVAGAETSPPTVKSNYGSYAIINNSNTLQGMTIDGAYHIRIRYFAEMSLADWKAKLASTNMVFYYALATPTDTEITDNELIEQLDHIYSLYGGVNNLWLIPSGGALGEIGVRFPTSYSLNGSGYEWEEGAGSAQNIVYVEGIDRTLPVWKVVGPANNPTLTNVTTGQTISWQSYVPEGQELIVDMDAQTAMLSGANVFAFIEGEWLELQTGQNRLDYSAEGATDPSTIEWNGVVG